MNVRCTALHLPILTLCASIAFSASPFDAGAFELAGTGDLDIVVGDDGDTCTIVAVAGFEIAADERLNERTLIGFVEYGPDEAIEGVCDAAGQLWFEVPTVRSFHTESRLFDATDEGLVVGYEEWQAGGRTTFEGAPQEGWVDVNLVMSADGEEILSIDVVLNILLVDNARLDERVVEGIMFAGSIPQADPYPTPTGRDDRHYTRRTGGGCTGESDVVIVTDPYDIDRSNSGSGCDDDPLYDDYDDGHNDSYTTSSNSGCEGDSFDSSSSDDSGCEGSSSSSYSSTDTSCEGDTFDGGSSSSSESMDCSSDNSSSSKSDFDCEGDTFDEKSAGGVAVAMRRLAPRGTTYYLKRTLPFWAPIAFIVLGHRRRRPGM